MTPEQQRIAIAQACGWKRIPADNVGSAARLFYGDVWWRDADNNTIACVDQLPDYLNDLNAIHEAEKILSNSQIWQMDSVLFNMADCVAPFRATASQRAEAFLRTLNLWIP